MIAEQASDGMNNSRLRLLIEQAGSVIEGRIGFWRFEFLGRELVTVTDESHNRLRIMTPVVGADELTKKDLETILSANFGRALDAKYALSQRVVWAVFMHPLRELNDAQVLDAMQQVSNLANNYGTSYTSSDIVFGDGD
jgi:hypothetical protein